VLRVLVAGALETNPRKYSPDELAVVTNVANYQAVANAIRQAGLTAYDEGLPRYMQASGQTWHSLWHWSGTAACTG
jgi:hypothetical protein